MKQNASLDASFWINVCAGNIVHLVSDYFQLFTPEVAAQEIRYPITALGVKARTAVLFNEWIKSGDIQLQEPAKPVDWFQSGENAAIALAVERGYFLLIDDANPYHRAKAAGLKVVGSSELAILFYEHGRITYEITVTAIRQTHASKKQKRLALTTLETLKRLKGN